MARDSGVEVERGDLQRERSAKGDSDPNAAVGQAAIRYEVVTDEYFEARGLRRHARVGSLWALGVGAVISGDFFGWNFGLGVGGFGGMLIALVLATVMYAGLCFSIAEMSPALPHTGGAYSFARAAFGPWGGYLTGLAENMEYVLTPAVIVVGIGGYAGALFGTGSEWAPLWWLLMYALFVGLNVRGVEVSFRLGVVVTVLALVILLAFYVVALPGIDFAKYAWTVAPSEGNTEALPFGWLGVVRAIPFAIWFYLAIEQLPLAAEESHDPRRDIPKGLLWGFLTLVVCAFATLCVSAGSAPGAAALAKSEEPLFEGLAASLGIGAKSRVLAGAALVGLLASFHSIIFAYGRQIYSLSRSGYFPRVLSLTHHRYKTPHVALLVGAALGYTAALTIHWLGPQSPVGAVLLNMTVFGAVLSYVLQMASFIALRVRFPNLERPYRSPLGIAGATVALVLSVFTLGALFIGGGDYLDVTLGAAAWFALGVVYFASYARRRLVLAPEEEFALRARERTS
jgi:ethanolamine permease